MNKWIPHRNELIAVALVMAALAGLLKFSFNDLREKRRYQSCQINLKQLGLAMLQYTRNYDEVLPPQDRWSEVLLPYSRDSRVTLCPSAINNGYAMNRYLVGTPSYARSKNPAREPMIFDSLLQSRNASDTGQSWPTSGRHPQGNNVAFLDGHVKCLPHKPQFSPLPGREPSAPTTPAQKKR